MLEPIEYILTEQEKALAAAAMKAFIAHRDSNKSGE